MTSKTGVQLGHDTNNTNEITSIIKSLLSVQSYVNTEIKM